MCGIVGLFAKQKNIKEQLGSCLGKMLVEMTERGPDSAGVALYNHSAALDGAIKVSLLAHEKKYDWSECEQLVSDRFGSSANFERKFNQALVLIKDEEEAEIQRWFNETLPNIVIISIGESIEIYKGIGLPKNLVENIDLEIMQGSHALGHTRMATESAVTAEHSHPFTTGNDLCLVHNGSLSNHNRLREKLIRYGVQFQSDNDSEVAAGFLTWRLREGDSLEEALERGISELDGFYTFAVGTKDGFAVMRDPIACKPAVIAENDEWVAMASEYRAIATLPNATHAQCWEPKPTQIYSWSH